MKLYSSLIAVFAASIAAAADPCKSGLQTGQRPGPYSAVIATGPQRGQSFCYICETGDNPAMLVFARSLSAPLGKLAARMDTVLTDHKSANLRAWITFLSDDQVNLDPKVNDWAKKHAIRAVPLGIFEDVVGPPSYRLAQDADVTVLLFVKRKVTANFAFRAEELNDERIEEIVRTLPAIVGKKP